MKEPMNFTGRWILVTGASSGLGLEMATQLATRHHANLILTARREPQLRALAAKLETTAGIRCAIIVADMAKPDDVDRVFREAAAVGEVYGVILNAGVTRFGRHLDMPWTEFQQLLATNVSSVVRLTSLFAPYLIEQGSGGGIMNVSSMAGLLPVPYQAAYAGSKAFVTNFTQSLQQELHDAPISLTVFSPGGIDTEMTQNSALRHFENTPLLQTPEACAAAGINALRTRKALAVPGLLNRQQLLLTRFVPRSLVSFITRRTYEAALDKS